MAAPVIHLNGWPGTGKLTIARAMVDLTGARLLHNHLMLDAAGALFKRGTSGHAKLRKDVTEVLVDAAQDVPRDVPIIVTNALAETPEDHELLAPFLAMAERRQAPFLPFTLQIEAEENRRRVSDPSRFGRLKLTDTSYLDGLRSRYVLLVPPNARDVDVTHLSAEAAAQKIVAMVESV